MPRKARFAHGRVPIRTALALTDAERAAIAVGEDLSVIGDCANPPKKERTVRTKAERLTNPYEWEIQRATVTLLRRCLAEGYLVQAHVQEREGAARLWAWQQGQDDGWPDLEVTGDGDVWSIEMKDRDGVLSASQKRMFPRLIRAGRKLLPICRSPLAAAVWLRENGARFRVFPS